MALESWDPWGILCSTVEVCDPLGIVSSIVDILPLDLLSSECSATSAEASVSTAISSCSPDDSRSIASETEDGAADSSLSGDDSECSSKTDSSAPVFATAFSNTDKIAWAKKMIADEDARHKLCDREFVAADNEGRGTLHLEEFVGIVRKICNHMAVELPPKDKIIGLVSKVQKAKGSSPAAEMLDLSPHKFRATMKAVLKSVVQEAEKHMKGAEAAPSLGASLVNHACYGGSLAMFRHITAEHLEPGEVCLELALGVEAAFKTELLRAIVHVPGVISATIEGSIVIVVTRTVSIAQDEAFHAELLTVAGDASSIICIRKHQVSVEGSLPIGERAPSAVRDVCSDDDDVMYLDEEEDLELPSQTFSFFSPTNFLMARRLQDYGDDRDVAFRLGTVKWRNYDTQMANASKLPR